MDGRTQTLEDEFGSTTQAMLVPQSYLVLVMEASAPRAGGGRFALAGASEVHLGRGTKRGALRHVEGGKKRLDISVAAPAMSSRHARLVRVEESWLVEDLGSRNGTWINGERVMRAVVEDGDLLQLGDAFFVLRLRWPSPVSERALEEDGRATVRGLATLHPELGARHRALEHIARSRVPVLVLGESGTGKELAARAVHTLSGRSGDFVAINCGAVPETLAESLFFGHARGAFSGASRDQLGLVRAADGGTLFLDEIGDMALASQAVLLRALQEKEVTPLGATRAHAVDVRVVAATHRPLDALAKTSAFRTDLLARLRGHVHALPPLAARREDMGLLVASLADDAGCAIAGFDVRAARALLQYAWPLNIRELQMCLASAAALACGRKIGLEHLPREIASAAPCAFGRATTSSANEPDESADDATRARLVDELAAAKGNVAAVGRSMGKAPIQIRRWMKRWHIAADTFRTDQQR